MPPKEIAKKPPPAVARPPISDSSLLYVPEDAVEGFQDRIESDIEWTLVEQAARHHKILCRRGDILKCTFTEALQVKLENSIFHTFIDKNTNLSLVEQWELLLPIILWDNEKFSNDEGKICFRGANNLTDDMIKIIKKAVKVGDRDLIMKDFYLITTLRVNDAKMTELDNGLKKFKNLITLTLCGNFINDIDATNLPPRLKSLELQANAIKSVSFAEHLPSELLYLGLSKNLLNDDSVDSLSHIPHNITVLDLSDNDIYRLEPLLDALARLRNLSALHLAGNPCSVCAGYARVTLMRLPRLRWLDSREILVTDRSVEPFEPHPDDLRAAFFNFTIFRIMSTPPPPKPEKGAVTAFHVELELPLLDPVRRAFLMFRNNSSLTEMLPPPEDDEDVAAKITQSSIGKSKSGIGGNTTDIEIASQDSDIYNRLVAVNSREIRHYTIFESNKIQWNKVMNFQEPAIKIFCPDLVALRDTFRSTITIRLIYSMTITTKSGKDKKSQIGLKQPGEQRVTLATIKCGLNRLDWSQPSQHFHWDDTMNTDEAIHWGDGDLSVIQYSQAPVKVAKGKQESEVGSARQMPPENLTCHFGFGIDTLKA